MATNILLVGYTVAVKEDLHGLVPSWAEVDETKVPAEELAAQISIRDASRKTVRDAIAADPVVHLCELSRVVIADPQLEQVFDSKGFDKPAALTTAGWLMDHYKDAWGTTPFDWIIGPPKVSFYGFDMRLFVKLLGLGAAELGHPLPAGLWYTNSDHRDMEGAMLPSQCVAKKFTLIQAMDAMGMRQDVLNPISATWVPRVDPQEDVRIAAEIATRLGLLLVKKTEKVGKAKPTKK